jgi:AraC family transcriptional regulator
MAAAGISPTEWVKLMPRPPSASSAALGWSHLHAYRFRNPARWQLELPALDCHFIVAHLANPCEMSSRWSGRVRRHRSVPGNLMIMCAHQESLWDWVGEIEELHLFLDPQLLAAAAGEVSERPVSLVEGLGITDPTLTDIALRLTAELANPGMCGRLFGEAMAHALTLQLLRQHSTLRSERTLERLDIPTRRLRIALDYIEEHLGEEMPLAAIAAAAGMSSFRFARGFRKAMNRAPHQYVIARRIERAKELLHVTDQSVGEIATSVGFASQSHFTLVFNRHCGVPPSRYRKVTRS